MWEFPEFQIEFRWIILAFKTTYYPKVALNTHGQMMSSSFLLLIKLKPDSVIGFSLREQRTSSSCPHGVFELQLNLQHFVIKTTVLEKETRSRPLSSKLSIERNCTTARKLKTFSYFFSSIGVPKIKSFSCFVVCILKHFLIQQNSIDLKTYISTFNCSDCIAIIIHQSKKYANSILFHVFTSCRKIPA